MIAISSQRGYHTGQRLIFLGDDAQVRELEADLAWVEEHRDEARKVLSEAVAHRVPVVSLDAFYESLMGKVSPEWASRPSWAIEHVLPRAGSSYAFVKRLINAAASALLLLAFAPRSCATSCRPASPAGRRSTTARPTARRTPSRSTTTTCTT